MRPAGFEPATKGFKRTPRTPSPSRLSSFTDRDYGEFHNPVKSTHTGSKTRESTRYRRSNPVETGSGDAEMERRPDGVTLMGRYRVIRGPDIIGARVEDGAETLTDPDETDLGARDALAIIRVQSLVGLAALSGGRTHEGRNRYGHHNNGIAIRPESSAVA